METPAPAVSSLPPPKRTFFASKQLLEDFPAICQFGEHVKAVGGPTLNGRVLEEFMRLYESRKEDIL
jgi:hypothetical protein